MPLETIPKDLSSASHLGVVVRDTDKTAKFLSSLGLGPWETFEFSPAEETLIAGKPFRLKVAYGKLWGSIALELLQPLDETSVWAKFLETNGEGVHHVGFSVSNFDEMVSKLKEQGNTMTAGATAIEGKRFCYFDTKPGGIVIEIMEDDLHDKAFPKLD